MERKAGLAVLIDADNVQVAALPVVLDDIFKRRTAAVRRVYGDFSNPCLHPRLARIQAHAFPGSKCSLARPARTPATSRSSSTPWTCCTPAPWTAC